MKKGIYNKTTKENININLKYADTYFKRLKGLMFKKNIDYGLVFIIKAKNSDLSDTVKIVQAPKSDIFIGDVTFETEQDLIDFKVNKGIGDIEIFENPNELLDFLKDY